MRTTLPPEYEPQLPIERERKLVPLQPHLFGGLKERAYPIEQPYLSHPDEPFSVRLRKTPHGFSAALKTRSPRPDGPLTRIEVETDISEQAYRFYTEKDATPIVRKLRTDIVPGVIADWLPGQTVPVIEVEHGTPEAATFLRDWSSQLQDVTRDPAYDNERIAHALWAQHNGQERPIPPVGKESHEIVAEIIEKLQGRHEPLIIGIRGRSGSGKTTMAKEVAFWLESLVGAAPVISTDDYHRGKRWLLETHQVDSWQNWDDPVVYHTKLLAYELQRYLESSEPLPRRRFNFTTEEPETLPEEIDQAPVVIVEGLFPHSADLRHLIDAVYEVPTPLATSLGRRIMRDIGTRLNNSLGSAQDILRYQLEVAEPTYQRHSR